MIISITINSHAQCTLRAYSSIYGMSAMFFPRIKKHNEQNIQIQEDPFKPLVSIDLIIFKLNKPQQHAWSRAIMWGLIKKKWKESKGSVHTSVKINEDTITTYARKKKIAICTKNFGLSLMFGDVTALSIAMENN